MQCALCEMHFFFPHNSLNKQRFMGSVYLYYHDDNVGLLWLSKCSCHCNDGCIMMESFIYLRILCEYMYGNLVRHKNNCKKTITVHYITYFYFHQQENETVGGYSITASTINALYSLKKLGKGVSLKGNIKKQNSKVWVTLPNHKRPLTLKLCLWNPGTTLITCKPT